MSDWAEIKSPLQRVAKLSKGVESAADSYLARLVDFAKWTSTLTIGAMLWIVNSFTDHPTQYRTPTVVALFLLSLSLLFSLAIGAIVLFARNRKWKSYQHEVQAFFARYGMGKTQDPQGLEWLAGLRDEEYEKADKEIDRAIWAFEAMSSWLALVFHLLFLFLGIGSYAYLQLRYVLTFTSPLSP